MKRRLNLIASLLHQPEILFLDEPTEGIDVQSRNAILEYLKKLNAQQKTTIIYTSHLLAEAEDLCEEVIIIDKGTKLLEGTMAGLKGSDNTSLQEVFLKLTGTNYRDLS
jgi:ABC-2 type transport system ATP-binding protein